MVINIKVGDILIMKKKHPCGDNRMLVEMVGSDIKIKCTNCSREAMVPRIKLEKNIVKIESNK